MRIGTDVHECGPQPVQLAYFIWGASDLNLEAIHACQHNRGIASERLEGEASPKHGSFAIMQRSYFDSWRHVPNHADITNLYQQILVIVNHTLSLSLVCRAHTLLYNVPMLMLLLHLDAFSPKSHKLNTASLLRWPSISSIKHLKDLFILHGLVVTMWCFMGAQQLKLGPFSPKDTSDQFDPIISNLDIAKNEVPGRPVLCGFCHCDVSGRQYNDQVHVLPRPIGPRSDWKDWHGKTPVILMDARMCNDMSNNVKHN